MNRKEIKDFVIFTETQRTLRESNCSEAKLPVI